MLIVSRNSWHYKFIRAFNPFTDIFLNGNVYNFCSYARYFIGTLIVFLSLIVISVFLIWGLAEPILYALFGVYTELGSALSFVSYPLLVILFMICSMENAFVDHNGAWYRKPISYYFKRHSTQNQKPKQSLIKEYFISKKEKYCPTVKFID